MSGFREKAAQPSSALPLIIIIRIRIRTNKMPSPAVECWGFEPLHKQRDFVSRKLQSQFRWRADGGRCVHWRLMLSRSVVAVLATGALKVPPNQFLRGRRECHPPSARSTQRARPGETDSGRLLNL